MSEGSMSEGSMSEGSMSEGMRSWKTRRLPDSNVARPDHQTAENPVNATK